MRAAVMYEQGKPTPYSVSRPLVVEDVELDGPGPGEVLVQIAAAGLCHSDLSAIAGMRARAVPTVVGHEAAAIIREVGPGVTDLKPGDHVVMVFVASCGHCAHCYGGHPNLCEASWEARSRGTLQSGARKLRVGNTVLNHYTGLSVFAEYAVVSQNSLVRIAPDIPLEDAAIFGCAVITGVGAVVNTAKVPFGSTVAVVGLGGVGLSALLGAHACGASRIIAIDVSEEKLCLARQLGATDTFNARDPKSVEAVRMPPPEGWRLRLKCPACLPLFRPHIPFFVAVVWSLSPDCLRQSRHSVCRLPPWSAMSAESRAAIWGAAFRSATFLRSWSCTAAVVCR